MPVYADCEVVVVTGEVAGAEAGLVLVLVVPADDLQSAAQLLDVSGPSHVPSPQHCFVCPTAHGVAAIPPPPAGIPPPPLVDVGTATGVIGVPVGVAVGALVLGTVTVDDLQSAAQLLDVSGPSHVLSPQHCFVCPTAHGVAAIPPLPAGIPPPPLVEVPVFEVGVTPAGGTRCNLSAMGIVRGAHMS